MIELRPYKDADGAALAEALHDVSLEELSNTNCETADVPAYLAAARERGRVTTCLIDGEIAFVGASICEVMENKRSTAFFIAAGVNEGKLGLAMRKWSRAEKGACPGATFKSYCYGSHHKRDRFLALAGLAKVRELDNGALFST